MDCPRFLNAKELCSLPVVREKVYNAVDKAYEFHDNPNALCGIQACATTTMKSGFEVNPDFSLQVIVFAPDLSLGYNQVVIAVRGTKTQAEWQTNMQIMVGENAGLRGHHGFFTMASSCWNELYTMLTPFLTNSRTQFLFVGHSLGGALSHVLSLYMRRALTDNYPSQVVNITMGQPSVWHTTPVWNGSHLQVERILGRDNIVRIICVGNKGQDPVTVLAQVGGGLGTAFNFIQGAILNFGVFKHIGWEWKSVVNTSDVICHDHQTFYRGIMVNDRMLNDSDFILSFHIGEDKEK